VPSYRVGFAKVGVAGDGAWVLGLTADHVLGPAFQVGAPGLETQQ